jgi:hypothetical protein
MALLTIYVYAWVNRLCFFAIDMGHMPYPASTIVTSVYAVLVSKQGLAHFLHRAIVGA